MWVSGQRHAPAALYRRGKTPGTHCTGGWVGPRAGLDTEDRGKILYPCRRSNPERPVVQPVVRHYTAWANPAPTRSWSIDIKSPDTLYVGTLDDGSHHWVKDSGHEIRGCFNLVSGAACGDTLLQRRDQTKRPGGWSVVLRRRQYIDHNHNTARSPHPHASTGTT
jgi:hypothetical protein